MSQTTPPRHARVTTIGNLKGGSGKTTNAVNLACMLAHGSGELPPQRVLFVDLEPLRTASRWLGVEAPSAEQSSAVLFQPVPRNGDREAHLERLRAAVRRAENEPVDLVPAHADGLEAADGVRGKEFDLKDNLALLAADYDYVFIDLPGSRTGRLIRSSLVASEGVLVPLQPGGNSIESTMDFFEMVEEIRRGANPRLQVDGIVISTAGPRGDVDAQIAAETLVEVLPYYPVYAARIRTLKAIQRASSFRVSVRNMGDREAVRDYTALLEEWMQAIGRLEAAV
ncbi:MAG TPA: ParA family protein [Longimicrobiaceae bacterium]|nr:ParA family protein [Longimicrobiaceae bacterium]